jgi:hypothetical protein
LLVSDLCYSQWKTVPEKALAISGADRSLVVAVPADYTRYL